MVNYIIHILIIHELCYYKIIVIYLYLVDILDVL